MLEAFRRGEGDYAHLQAPGPQLLEAEGAGWTAASVGAAMPEVAFSTLCCSREFLKSQAFADFMGAYREARPWVRTAAPEEVAATEAAYFPGVSQGALAEAIARYQKLGNWNGGDEITEPLYAQAQEVFAYSGEVEKRYPWSAVCV
jgi:NitT/TauT family transport system substrate-binding protein